MASPSIQAGASHRDLCFPVRGNDGAITRGASRCKRRLFRESLGRRKPTDEVGALPHILVRGESTVTSPLGGSIREAAGGREFRASGSAPDGPPIGWRLTGACDEIVTKCREASYDKEVVMHFRGTNGARFTIRAAPGTGPPCRVQKPGSLSSPAPRQRRRTGAVGGTPIDRRAHGVARAHIVGSSE